MLNHTEQRSYWIEEKIFLKPLCNLTSELQADPRLARAWRTIETEYDDSDLRLDRMARAAGMSKNRLRALCQQQTGFTPHELLMRYRVFQAAVRLLGPGAGLTLLDIAIEAGFGNRKTFYRWFRQVMATSPSNFLQAREKKVLFVPHSAGGGDNIALVPKVR